MNKLVSIVIVTYNQEQMVGDAIDSVLEQDLNLITEIIIADDCSTDNTRDVIKSYEKDFSKIIKPIYRSHNLGVRKNATNAWKKCKGKYIACIAGDDIWIDKNKIKSQLEFLENNKDYVFIGTNAILWNVEDNSYILKDDPNGYRVLKPKDFFLGGPVIGSSIMWVNTNDQGLIDLYNKHGDTRFFMHLSNEKKGGICDYNNFSTVYRVHNASITLNHDDSYKERKYRLISRIMKNYESNAVFNNIYADDLKRSDQILIKKIVIISIKNFDFVTSIVFASQLESSYSSSIAISFFIRLFLFIIIPFKKNLNQIYLKKINKK